MTSKNPLPPIYLLDGGLGTTLADTYNYIFDNTTPLWSSQLLITDPATLLKAQTAFADAGADVILSATYQASFEGFARAGVDELDAGVFMRDGVEIARRAFGGKKGKGKVALSLGAYGAVMVPSQEYSGEYDGGHVTREALREWHLKRLGVFLPDHGVSEEEVKGKCWQDVDYVAFETLPRIDEVGAVRDVMSSAGKERQKPFWISCVFPGEGTLLPDGSSVREVAKAMLGKSDGGAVPIGIGINCTKVGKVQSLILEFEDAIKELVGNGEIEEWPSLVVYPDGTNGEFYNTVTKEWEKGGSDRRNEVSLILSPSTS
jgi:homocysteine S-methyltransferase